MTQASKVSSPVLRFTPRRLALALAACSWVGLAQGAPALPTGMQVVQGQASAVSSGNKLIITSSHGAILNWNSFSVGAQNAVRFEQPGAASQVLNRVLGNDPSQILGQLSSNGKVWLLNPNGVLFGPGARVDVTGLVTSTLTLNDQDWSAGRYVFSSANGLAAGTIVNQGEIRSSSGGQVLLLAGAGGVRNEGLIDTSGGQIVLAAGGSIELLDTATPRFTVKLTAPAGEVLNLGQLGAAGGRIDLQAASVNQQGLLRADSLALGPAGEIVIKAAQRLVLGTGSVTAADAVNGPGGQIRLLGQEVGLADGASVSASGGSGGGTVLVGGGVQGRDASVPNADAVFLAPGASIRADATSAGDGGRIVLWGNSVTRAYGTLSASGGSQGGNGGFIETSGGWLDARPARLDVSAARGRAGQWLLDPHDLHISDGVSDFGAPPTGNAAALNFTTTADDATLSTATIVAALNAGTNVTISTAGAGTQNGTIFVGTSNDPANIGVSAITPGSLSLLAEGDIVLDHAQISSSGDGMDVTLRAGANASVNAPGMILLTASSISSSGGAILLGGFASGAMPEGGSFANGAAGGIRISNGSSLDAGDALSGAGTLEIRGLSANSSAAVTVNGYSQLRGQRITINGASSGGRGVELVNAALTSTGAMTIQGVGGNFTGSAEGVMISGDTGLTASPNTFSTGAKLSIAGRSTGGSDGLSVALNTSHAIVSGNGAAMSLYGETPSSSNYAVRLGGHFDSSWTLDVHAAGAGNVMLLNLATLDSSQNSVYSGAASMQVNSSQISSNHKITLEADSLVLNSASISSNQPSGEAILIAGNGGQGIGHFVNNSGASALSSSERWIIWSADITDSSNFDAGGLARDFSRHGVSGPEDWAADTGNGLVSTATQTATLFGSVQSKAYDGTRAAQVSSLGISTPLGSGSISASASVQFDSKDAGYGAVNLVDPNTPVSYLDGSNKPIYGLTLQSGMTAQINPAALSLTFSAADKVYDRSNAANVTVAGVSGYVPGESLVISATGSFEDRHVGQAKRVGALMATLNNGPNGELASNYFYSPGSAGSLTASITPLPLSINGLTAGNKVYDRNTAASLAGTATVAPLSGDVVSVSGSAIGAFADHHVGTAKPVSLSGLGLAGADAGNYSLAPSVLSASITPATLSYVAEAVSKPLNAPLPAFSGGVTGFLAGETLAGATTGTLSFSSTAGESSPVGSYAVNGQGLSAGNYQFVQAGSNATALSITAPETAAPPPLLDQASTVALQSVSRPIGNALPAATTNSSSSNPTGMLDLTTSEEKTAAAPGASGTASPAPAGPAAPATAASFAPVRISGMSMDALAALLDGRDKYKQTLFADATNKLAENPALADARACQSLADAQSGACLVTDSLKAQAQAVAPAPAPAPATAATAAAPAATAELRALSLPARRQVRAAALPQIERKVAVVVGVDAYADPSIPTLANAVNDARAVGTLFEGRLGYETVVIPNASKAAVIGTLNRLALAMGPKDSVVIYYAGHGDVVEATGQGYWLLADADAKRPETWLSNADIGRLIAQIGASQVALISDSCYSGSLVSDERIRASGSAIEPAQLLQRKSVVVMSSGGNEPVSDAGKQGHSPFTWNLLNQLGQVREWQAGGHVFERVRFAVARELPQRPRYGASSAAGHQRGGDYLFEQRQLETERQ